MPAKPRITPKKPDVKNYRSKLSGIGPLVDADAPKQETITVVTRGGGRQERLKDPKYKGSNSTIFIGSGRGSRGQPRKGLAPKEPKNEPVVSTQQPRVEALRDIGALRIPDNELLPYVNLQYHLVLSMVPEPKVVNIQKTIPVGASPAESTTFNQLQRAISAEGSVPFASTGDVFKNEVVVVADDFFGDITRIIGGKNYYNIESLTLSNVMAPTPQNPYINSMISGKMALVEPHGFKFYEDVRRIGNKLGYSGLSPGRILWRLDIFFSGYNQDTGEWMSFIPMDTRTRKTNVLTYYLNITTAEAKVSHTGTTYDMSMVPSGHSAYRPEELVVDAGAIFTGSQSQTQTFGGFLERVSQAMNKAVSDRTNEQVKRKYEFKAPPELLNAEFFSGDFERKQGFITNDPKSGSVVTPARDVNVLTLIEDSLKDLPVTWKNFLKQDDKKHLKPRIHWGIRFNVIHDSGANPGTNDYDLITNQYIIEPFVTYKHAKMNNRAEMAAIVDAKTQTERVIEMIKLGMINRVYDYINTSQNQEVIDVDLRFKNFYYHTMYNPAESSSSVGTMQSESASSKATKITKDVQRVENEGVNSDDKGEVVPSNQENSTQSSLRRLFGRTDDVTAVCDSSTFQTPFDIYGGGFGEMPKSDYKGSVGGSDQLDRAEYQANLNDHLRNDLIRIEMQVRGDPIWLLTPYGKDSGNILASGDRTNDVTGTSALVQTQSSRCFFLRMFAPTQEDYMNPERASASTSCGIIGGFYETIKVESVFQGGKFIQTLTAAKMNHLNYVESFVNVSSNNNVITGQALAGDADLIT